MGILFTTFYFIQQPWLTTYSTVVGFMIIIRNIEDHKD